MGKQLLQQEKAAKRKSFRGFMLIAKLIVRPLSVSHEVSSVCLISYSFHLVMTFIGQRRSSSWGSIGAERCLSLPNSAETGHKSPATCLSV